MNKISKQLIKIAREIKALDEEGDGSGFQMQHDHENREIERLDIAQKHGKKYILHHKEGGLWRIQACKNFGVVKKGNFGGCVESEKNLSHKGYCWIEYGAKVYDNAIVSDDARIMGKAWVTDYALVTDKAVVGERARVSGGAKISKYATVTEHACVSGEAMVTDDALVTEHACVSGEAMVTDYALVCGNAKISGTAKISGNATVDYDVEEQEITE